MRSIKTWGLVASIALVGSLVPLGAHAGEWCASNIVVFSGVDAVGSVNSNAAVCIAEDVWGEDTGYDGRIINPGSDFVSVRYVNPYSLTDETLTAYLDGLGFENTEITLTRVESATGEAVYDSEHLDLAADAVGCITASIPALMPDEAPNSFHTVGASCP
ncbi:MAG: hypothetical protein WDA27_00470 [Actinomycetota bacterium]